MHFIHQHASGEQIVFGLDWSPLIGGAPEQLGMQRARELNATHYVLAASSHGCAVGAVRLESAKLKSSTPAHSAAAIFSNKFPHGAQACLLTNKEGACWMLVCHAGVVLSHTDRWFVDESQAIEALESIRLRFPALQVQRESLEHAQGAPSWLTATLSNSSILKSVPLSRVQKITWVKRILCILIPATAGYLFFFDKQEMPDPVHENAESLWRQSLLEQSAQHNWHPYAQIQSVIQTWMQIPVLPMGWRLRKIQCESSVLKWDCAAHFVRQHRMALNAHLEQLKPEGWRTEFSPLEEAAYLWRVTAASQTLDLSEQWMVVDWMSYLQKVGIAFEHIQIGQAALVPVKHPVDRQGQPLPKPDIFPDWKQRTLVMKGPLRVLQSLDGLHMPVRWRRLSLSIDRQAPQALNRSALTLELVGEMFESRMH